MSAYKLIECEIKDRQSIIAGLLDMGLNLSDIEIHDEAISLQDFVGKNRPQKANIIVRRKAINKTFSTGMSNDVGFEKVEGKYKAHISDYDMSWWKRREPKFKQIAATESIISAAKKKGYHVQQTNEDNNIKLKLIKNF